MRVTQAWAALSGCSQDRKRRSSIKFDERPAVDVPCGCYPVLWQLGRGPFLVALAASLKLIHALGGVNCKTASFEGHRLNLSPLLLREVLRSPVVSVLLRSLLTRPALAPIGRGHGNAATGAALQLAAEDLLIGYRGAQTEY